jgi:hypothetical protein
MPFAGIRTNAARSSAIARGPATEFEPIPSHHASGSQVTSGSGKRLHTATTLLMGVGYNSSVRSSLKVGLKIDPMPSVSKATIMPPGRALATVMCVLLLALPACGQTKTSALSEVRDSKRLNLADIVKKVLDVNSVWLDPRPTRLSYTLVGSVKTGVIEEKATNRVWIDDDKARWEMETQAVPPHTRQRLAYTLLFGSGKEMYVRAPRDSMLFHRRTARDIWNLKQGITWSTAIHAIKREGLPAGSQIVEAHPTDNGQIAVLLMDFGDRRCEVGLGLYHQWFGRAQMQLGRVRLHVRLPDHVLVLEEYVDRDVRIEYEPNVLVFGERRAPAAIKYVGKLNHRGGLPNRQRWEMEAHFKKQNGLWLLDRAVNRQDGKTVAEMALSNTSMAGMDQQLFAFPPAR